MILCKEREVNGRSVSKTYKRELGVPKSNSVDGVLDHI